MTVHLFAAARAALLAEMRRALPLEACGLLGGHQEGEDFLVEEVLPLENVAKSPRRFMLAPRDQFDAVRKLRARGLSLLGNWHSHPTGPCAMSRADLAMAFDERLLYLICAPEAKGMPCASGTDGARIACYRVQGGRAVALRVAQV